MKHTRTLALLVLLVFSSQAHALFFSGNRLLDHLQSTNQNEQSAAHGYIMGVFDAYLEASHCAPATIPASQLIDMTQAWLVANPSVRHFPADAQLGLIFKRAWPCSKKPSVFKGSSV